MKNTKNKAEMQAKWEKKEKQKKMGVRVLCLVISVVMILALFSTVVYSLAS